MGNNYRGCINEWIGKSSKSIIESFPVHHRAKYRIEGNKLFYNSRTIFLLSNNGICTSISCICSCCNKEFNASNRKIVRYAYCTLCKSAFDKKNKKLRIEKGPKMDSDMVDMIDTLKRNGNYRPAVRVCLVCESEFDSTGHHNRRCQKCTKNQEELETWNVNATTYKALSQY